MTFYVDAEDDDPGPRSRREPGRGGRVLTWFVIGALALITLNIGIAAIGGRHVSAPKPAPAVPVRPTAAAPSPPSPGPDASQRVDVPAPVLPSLPLPTPGTARSRYPSALGAITAGGDVVLVDPNDGRTLRVLVANQPGAPVVDISWDAAHGIMYFDRDGDCPAIYRFRLEFGRAELFAVGSHPVVSPDGSKVAVTGTGCGPGGQKASGVGVYASATGLSQGWTPLGNTPEFSQPLQVVDTDWRADGKALAVTLGGGENSSYRLLTLDGKTPELAAAPEIPVMHRFPETFDQLEYVGARLLMVGSCCETGDAATTWRLALRQPADGSLTSIRQGALGSVTANSRGDIRFLDAATGRPGRLWSLHIPDRSGLVGGGVLGPFAFLRIDW